jgi:hypothetical protein
VNESDERQEINIVTAINPIMLTDATRRILERKIAVEDANPSRCGGLPVTVMPSIKLWVFQR